jgi:hypothetical protein
MFKKAFLFLIFTIFSLYNSNSTQAWTQINIDGFGDPNNLGSAPMCEYNNYLYVSTDDNEVSEVAEIWRYDGATWIQETWGWLSDNYQVESMIVMNTYFYMGTKNRSTGCEVWASSNGSTWSQVNTDGFGDPYNIEVDKMVEYGNNLYAGTNNRVTGGEVWQYNGSTWSQVNTDGFGDENNNKVCFLVVYNNNLYAGTDNEVTGGEVWRYDGGVTWTQVNTDGFGDPNNEPVVTMVVYDNNLYAGTVNAVTGGEVWQYNGSTWSQVNTDGFGNPNNAGALPAIVNDNILNVGTWNEVTGGEIWGYNGSTWERIDPGAPGPGNGGFGDSNNIIAAPLIFYKNRLYATTRNEVTGGEVWGDYIMPIPDIKANGTDGPVTGTYGTPISITVALNSGDYSGQNADWWIVSTTPMGLYSYVYPTGWALGLLRCVAVPLFDLTQIEILNFALPVGNYTFFFAVDDDVDGVPDATFLDSVEVNIQP